MAADVLAPCITRTSAPMVQTMQNKSEYDCHEYGFQLYVPSVLRNDRKCKCTFYKIVKHVKGLKSSTLYISKYLFSVQMVNYFTWMKQI